MFKLPLSICLILFPLIITHVITHYYSANVVRNQVIQSNRNLLNLHVNQIESDLKNASNYVRFLSTEDSFVFYQIAENIGSDSFVMAKINLFNTVSRHLVSYPAVDAIFIYSVPYQDFTFSYQERGSTYSERAQAITAVQQKLVFEPETLANNSWTVFTEDGKYYLLYIIKDENVYLGAWVDMERLITSLELIDFGTNGETLIATANFTPITGREFLSREGLELQVTSDSRLISGNSGRFISIYETSSLADFNVFALIPEEAVLENLPLLRRVSVIVVGIATLFLLLFVALMRRIFLKPAAEIVLAMREIWRGNWDVRLPERANSTEFQIMNSSFNRMIKEIKELKIDNYEKQIERKNAELRHLQAQVNPHFFLNSLNIIFNLATAGEYRLIQDLAKSLANYFRFVFRSSSYFVTLADEIRHTENYLHIQQLRFPDVFTYHVDLEADLAECLVPPLTIQSLVENSIKHAFEAGVPLEIAVSIKRSRVNSSLVEITVADTGSGFPNEVLHALKADEDLGTPDGKRIGIWNLRRRLALLYEDEPTKMSFSNEPGAVVRLQIPAKFEA